jgi:FHA domain
MFGPEASRRRIARVLNAAYADGLLSEETFAHRLDQALGERLIDPLRLIGDLNLRSTPRRWRVKLGEAIAAATVTLRLIRLERADDAVLLALDWNGMPSELVIGRSRDCDVVLGSQGVSRRHARLLFRDGHWVIRDLGSTNGTLVNGVRVGRCRLHPGDRVIFGDSPVRID